MDTLQKTWTAAALTLACLWTITPDALAIGGQPPDPNPNDPCEFNSTLHVSCTFWEDETATCGPLDQDKVPSRNEDFPPSFFTEPDNSVPPEPPWCDGCNRSRPRWVAVHCNAD